jgi:hypothetical protein
MGHSVGHGNFLAKNIATREVKYTRLKVCGMYLYVLWSDGVCVKECTCTSCANHGDAVSELFSAIYKRLARQALTIAFPAFPIVVKKTVYNLRDYSEGC